MIKLRSNSRLDPALVPDSPDLTFEYGLWQAGLRIVAGIDEAGRGALAGPVAAAAVILPPETIDLRNLLSGVRDSKQMTAEQRFECAGRIRRYALACAVGMSSAEEIDRLGIVPATRLAVQRALDGLSFLPEHLLLDYLILPENCTPHTALIKGDCRSLSIAAASVLAKTSRDVLMVELDTCFPGYGLSQHKGYGTFAHRQAISRLGLSAIHRSTFTIKEKVL
jgi:ribonuclease HII